MTESRGFWGHLRSAAGCVSTGVVSITPGFARLLERARIARQGGGCQRLRGRELSRLAFYVRPAEQARIVAETHKSSLTKAEVMSILFVIIAIVAIVLAVTGGLVHAVSFLLWVGIVLLILAVIAFLIRSISGRSRV